MTVTVVVPCDLVTVLRVYHDVTERLKHAHEALAGEVHRLRGELNQKNLELRQREHLAALGQMTAGIAHELRNPLGGIGIYASILQKELVDRPEQSEIAGRISSGVNNLEKIVLDILGFAGNGTQRTESIHIGALMKCVAAEVRRKLQDFNTDFEIDPELEELCIRGDSGRIERAMLNLCFNAIEAAGEDGKVWVRRGENDDEMIAIAVEDNGPGIDPGEIHKIFDPFFTTKDDGTGLGLAIAQRIAQSHGGFVRAGSRPGGGASFVLALPAGKRPKKDKE